MKAMKSVAACIMVTIIAVLTGDPVSAEENGNPAGKELLQIFKPVLVQLHSIGGKDIIKAHH